MEDKHIHTLLEFLLRMNQVLVLLLEQFHKFIAFLRELLQVAGYLSSEERVVSLYAFVGRDDVFIQPLTEELPLSLVAKRSREQLLEDLDKFQRFSEEVDEKIDHDLLVLLCELVGNPLEDENRVSNVVYVTWL